MSATQRYNQPTAFSTASSPHRLPVRAGTGAERGREKARGGELSPGPARSARKLPVSSRSRGETIQMLLMICCAAFCTVAGLAYLSCYVMMTNEAYRSSQLKGLVEQETRKAQHRKHQQALATTPATIEREAQRLGMVRPDEKQTIVVLQAR